MFYVLVFAVEKIFYCPDTAERIPFRNDRFPVAPQDRRATGAADVPLPSPPIAQCLSERI